MLLLLQLLALIHFALLLFVLTPLSLQYSSVLFIHIYTVLENNIMPWPSQKALERGSSLIFVSFVNTLEVWQRSLYCFNATLDDCFNVCSWNRRSINFKANPDQRSAGCNNGIKTLLSSGERLSRKRRPSPDTGPLNGFGTFRRRSAPPSTPFTAAPSPSGLALPAALIHAAHLLKKHRTATLHESLQLPHKCKLSNVWSSATGKKRPWLFLLILAGAEPQPPPPPLFVPCAVGRSFYGRMDG